jgi:hypothetical protein
MKRNAIRRRLAASTIVLALGLAVGAAAQQQKAPAAKEAASGKFEGREWTFEAHGAYAFPGEVGMDDEPGILVAVSNGTFSSPERLDVIWDRQYVIDTFLRDENTLIVYFHFGKDAKYKGMSYYFASGDGCGFCYNGNVKSTVKIEKGRIFGQLSLAEEPNEAFWDITFDAPVAPSDYGTPLPAGGGEQGKIYAAYHAALNGDTPAALKPMLDAEDQALLESDGKATLSDKREVHPTKSYEVTKGFVKGDHALLLVEGETEIMKVENEVHLVKIDGTWRVYNEIQQVKLGG